MHIALKWVTFAAAVALVWVFSKYGFGPYAALHPGHKTLDGTTFYKPSAVQGLLAALDGDHFLPKYLEQERGVDLIFPFVYGLMLIAPIVFLAPGARAPWWLAAIPLATVVADYTENFTLLALIKRYPSGDLGSLPYLASLASGTKGVGLLGSMGVIAVLVILWLLRR